MAEVLAAADGLAMVIVGAGQAGRRAALTLRAAGHPGPIILLGQEPYSPYERPPLSKQYLAGEYDLARCLQASDEALRAAAIDFRPSTIVTSIAPQESTVTLQDGRRIAYERLLLATGRAPRRPALSPDLNGHAHVLRNIEDAKRACRRRSARVPIL